jgi:hypothetical protein
MAPGAIGAARYFAWIPDLGMACLIELDNLAALFSVRQGTLTGLSGCFHMLEDTSPVPVHISEVSLTEHPADERCRVVSHGLAALSDWELLTGETVVVG